MSKRNSLKEQIQELYDNMQAREPSKCDPLGNYTRNHDLPIEPLDSDEEFF